MAFMSGGGDSTTSHDHASIHVLNPALTRSFDPADREGYLQRRHGSFLSRRNAPSVGGDSQGLGSNPPRRE